MIKCSECGYENMEGLDYCDGCGAKLAAGTGAGATPPPPAAAAAPSEPPAAPAPAEEPKAEPPAAEAAPEAPAPEAATPPPPEAPTPTPPPAAAAAPAAPAAGVLFKAKLTIVRGGRQGHEFPLENGNNLVGRWDPETGAFPEVDMEADDPEAKISRKHALVRIEDGKITVEDIGSLNGTYVNRQPRLQPGNPVEIKSGDELIIGKTFLKLTVEPLS
ncbi:MAG TPA: FHA domain-containing protein [Candidatus Binataceae bacterium]|nr:FHA domain-containing protein [Candidatus Binataceae bacterium]